MGSLDLVSTGEVTNPDLLARYICQTTGTPWASIKDLCVMKKKCKEFFQHYPHLDYSTLCHVADWAQRRKKRYSHVWKVVDAFRYAYEDGALPEVDNKIQCDAEVEEGIERALEVETDGVWRTQLIATQSVRARKEVLEDWIQMRKPRLVAS